MRVSLSVTDYSWPSGPAQLADELARIARVADTVGLESLWLTDHLIQAAPGSDPDSAMLEAYTALGYLAGQTGRIGLGAMVTPVTYREPAVLIKAVSTLDILSGGRAWLGIGAGYQRDEAAAMGVPLPPASERFERLEDVLRLADQMWSGDQSPFAGVHYRLARPINNPMPLRRPPILIGGMGEQKTLRLVAQYADACNLFDIPDGGRTVRHKLDVLARHRDDVGRPFSDISKTLSTRLEGNESAQSFARRCAAFAALGFDHAVVIVDGPWTVDLVSILGEAAALT